jgi:hypothetical protein
VWRQNLQYNLEDDNQCRADRVYEKNVESPRVTPKKTLEDFDDYLSKVKPVKKKSTPTRPSSRSNETTPPTSTLLE